MYCTVQWEKCIENFIIYSYSFPALVLAQHVLSSGHVRTTRNIVRAAFLASHQPWAFKRGQKMFSLYILPRTRKRKKTERLSLVFNW